jgi:hypothetical protein
MAAKHTASPTSYRAFSHSLAPYPPLPPGPSNTEVGWFWVIPDLADL